MPENTIVIGNSWYQLFSRGARDWLRHNEKIKEIAKSRLPDLISGSEIITNFENKKIYIPLALLEHARFKLNSSEDKNASSIGQGIYKTDENSGNTKEHNKDNDANSDNCEGNITLQVEMMLDDVIDFFWNELNLPDLKVKHKNKISDYYLTQEGWDRKGVRSRLDRRRTIKEFIKRRENTNDRITNSDLRFKQLIEKKNPATNAVIFFVLDVSASMSTEERKLAKSFFFFAMQGIRKKYAKVEIRFIAHTTQAWEFAEVDFFKVTGSGGTGASAAFGLTSEIIENEYDENYFNKYVFYASDGENFTEDRPVAKSYLKKLILNINYAGYIETVPGAVRNNKTEMSSICAQLNDEGLKIGRFILNKQSDIGDAIKHFFLQESEMQEYAQ